MSQAKFTQGSTMRHIVLMTGAGSVGLMALFVVDLVDMYFLSLLGETELAAAVGYAGSILFFTTSICIGIAIAIGALVSRTLGQKKHERAKGYAVNAMVYGVLLTSLIALGVWLSVPVLLGWLGAEDRALELASDYLRIIIPSMPVLALAMCTGGVLRAVGDARQAMYSTLAGGLVNAVLDPIFIFALGMGVKGAAWASVAARLTVLGVGWYGASHKHRLIGRFDLKRFWRHSRDISRIAIPAMLTNIATPIGNAYVIAAIARYGDGAVAGMSVIGRIIPVAFGVTFALSGAVGPIIGQNFGAKLFDRIRKILFDASLFVIIVVTAVSLLLFFLQRPIALAFKSGPEATELIYFFCTWIALSFIFNGLLFVANANFNNVGFAHYSTIFNFLKATVGTIPLVYLGGMMFEAKGMLAGQAVGSVIFGLAAMYTALRCVNRCSTGYQPRRRAAFNWRLPLWPQSTNRG